MVADTRTSVAPAGARRHRPFLALSVLPQLSVTDMGVVDVEAFAVVG